MDLKGFKLNATSSTVIAVGVVVLVVYLVIFYKPKTKDERDAGAISAAADADKNKALAELEAAGIKPTWDLFVYKQYADTIYTALDGADDELTVSRTFEHILNKADYILLDQAYGVRDDETMAQALVSDLEKEWIDQINNMLAANHVGVKI